MLRNISKDKEQIKALLSLPYVRESIFYTELRGSKVKCTLCNRYCVLDNYQVGTCGVRINVDGKLYTVTYGLLTAVESRPMEIKPFFHFYPGSTALTISTWGCTFPCAWCQNWYLSKYAFVDRGEYYPVDKLLKYLEVTGDEGINVSFNEPTLLTEYCIELFMRARNMCKHLSYNTNGYISIEAAKKLIEVGLNGANIDIKGDPETYRKWLCADFEKYWNTVKYLYENNIHIELTYLVIPGINDEDYEFIVNKILKDLGPDVPLHITRFHPSHLILDRQATPIDLLEKIANYAKKEGLRYVYVGNVPGHPLEHTHCPNCGKTVIKRYGMYVLKVSLSKRNGTYRCPNCGTEILIRGDVRRLEVRV